MKLFISWSGNKSKAAATALRSWLSDVIQAIEPWMSEHDLDAGARWNPQLSSQLEETRFGIICLTKANPTAPWLLFEAGALSKTLKDTFVCPYLIDLEPSDIPAGPLTQFQAKRANSKETLDLLGSINKALKDEALPNEQLKRSFERWWPELETALQALPAGTVSNQKARGLDEMVEEILGLVRGMSRRPKRPDLILSSGPKRMVTAKNRDDIVDAFSGIGTLHADLDENLLWEAVRKNMEEVLRKKAEDEDPNPGGD